MKTKILLSFILSLFIFCAAPKPAEASSLAAIESLKTKVVTMARRINAQSSEMMKFADMLICNAIHGEASYTTVDALGIVHVNLHLVSIDILLSGVILYILGFFIMMIASFYMFDVGFNLSIAIMILPMGFALWPFNCTRDKLKKMIEAVTYYTGIFIFLPLGIKISVKLVETVAIKSAIQSGANVSLEQAFQDDMGDVISNNLGLFTLGFLKVLLCYIVAMRIIPVMADEFCTHFFGTGLVAGHQSPLADRMKDMAKGLKEKTVGKLGKYGSDVAKHQAGNAIRSMGNANGNFLDRAIDRYGKNVGKTR